MIRLVFRRLAPPLLIVVAVATLPGCGTSRRVPEAQSAPVARTQVNTNHGPGHVVGLAVILKRYHFLMNLS